MNEEFLNEELLNALEENNTKKLDELIASGVDIKKRDEEGRTALFVAITLNFSIKMIRHLLEMGYSSINERDKFDMGPLLVAVKYGTVSLVHFLLAQPEITLLEQSNEGRHVLSYAADEDDVSMIRELLKMGAYIDMVRHNGKTAYEEIYGTHFKASEILKNAEILLQFSKGEIEELSKDVWRNLGDSLNARQIKTGNTALHCAVINKKTDLVIKLLELNANPTLMNHAKETALDLIQRVYHDHPYVLALAYSQGLYKQDMHRREMECHQLRKNILKKETKEQKETAELKLSNENEAYIEQCEKTFKKLERLFETLSDKELEKICFNLGILFQNGLSALYSPARAFQVFSRIAHPKFSRHLETNRWMLPLLLQRKFIFELQGMEAEPVPKNITLELDGNTSVETEQAYQFRLKEIIKYVLYSNSEHTEALKGYIAQYALGDAKSIMGIKNFKGNDPDSTLALIESLRSQTVALRDQELENKKLREEIEKLRRLVPKELEQSKETKENKENKENQENNEVLGSSAENTSLRSKTVTFSSGRR